MDRDQFNQWLTGFGHNLPDYKVDVFTQSIPPPRQEAIRITHVPTGMVEMEIGSDPDPRLPKRVFSRLLERVIGARTNAEQR